MVANNDLDAEKTSAELLKAYLGCQVKVADDKREIVAEVADGFAVAVVQRSVQHFYRKTREIYRVLRGTLFVACGTQGRVLDPGETMTIELDQIHFARAAGEPVWIEVESVPPWSAEDHFILG